MRRAALVGMVVLGLLVGALARRGLSSLSSGAHLPTAEVHPSTNADLGHTPSDLPPSYVREAEFPPDTFAGLTPQQRFTAIKAANEKSCTCGCPNDSVAKCRTHDPDCTTAPRLLGEIIADTRAGLSSDEILAKMGVGAPSSGTDDSNTLYAVSLGSSPTRGGTKAKVTLVEFGDFQCPACQQMEPVLTRLRARYREDLRVVFKEDPLPFHDHAGLAAEAAEAAGDQGKFWEMHDLLFRAPMRLERGDLERDAAELKLDLTAFRTALDHAAHQPTIDADRLLASQLGETATPVFFINGRKVVGVQSEEALAGVIDRQKLLAEQALAQGTPPEDVYLRLLETSHARLPARPAARPLSRVAHLIAVPKGSPSKGVDEAPVTLVEWGDFQCPFTAHAEDTVRQLHATYGDRLRIVWRNLPLPSHPAASPAARAALAANLQGKFWEVHDTLLAHAAGLRPDDIEELVQKAGVDMEKWRHDLGSSAISERLEADVRDGHAAGARGTPSFFINGLDVSGAQPLATYTALIEDQLQRATGMSAKDSATISEQLTAQNAAGSPVTELEPIPGFSDAPVIVNEGSAPTVGPPDAPVTIVEFSDFECPFCASSGAAVAALEEKYAGRVRVVFKQMPLAFHKHAWLAAKASMAADEQGKFWLMEEQLLQNSSSLERPSIDAQAKTAGLDLVRFKKAMESDKLDQRIKADIEQALALNIGSVPTFFVNGHRLTGAVPFETWLQVIDAELARKAPGDAGH